MADTVYVHLTGNDQEITFSPSFQQNNTISGLYLNNLHFEGVVLPPVIYICLTVNGILKNVPFRQIKNQPNSGFPIFTANFEEKKNKILVFDQFCNSLTTLKIRFTDTTGSLIQFTTCDVLFETEYL